MKQKKNKYVAMSTYLTSLRISPHSFYYQSNYVLPELHDLDAHDADDDYASPVDASAQWCYDDDDGDDDAGHSNALLLILTFAVSTKMSLLCDMLIFLVDHLLWLLLLLPLLSL